MGRKHDDRAVLLHTREDRLPGFRRVHGLEEGLDLGIELLSVHLAHDDGRLENGVSMTPGQIYQTENNWKFVKTVVLPALITRKSWTGDWPDLHTLGPLPDGCGRTIGGSGEFQGITGSFIEIGTTKEFSSNGDLAGEIELRLCYRLPRG